MIGNIGFKVAYTFAIMLGLIFFWWIEYAYKVSVFYLLIPYVFGLTIGSFVGLLTKSQVS